MSLGHCVPAEKSVLLIRMTDMQNNLGVKNTYDLVDKEIKKYERNASE